MSEAKLESSACSALVVGWESYERNGDGCVFFKSEDTARNHDLFDADRVVKAEVYLNQKGVEEFRAGIPIWF